MSRPSKSRRGLLLFAFAGMLFAVSSHANEECRRIVSELLSKTPNQAAWGSSSFSLQQAETARLRAAQSVNATSITVERIKAGTSYNYRILASSDRPAVHAYSYEGAVDFISRFADEVGSDRPLMIYLEGFPDDQSLSLRQTLRVHLTNDSYFLEAGPAVRPADLPSIMKRHPLLTDAKVSGEITKRDEMRVSVTIPVKESTLPMSIRVTIKVKGIFDKLSDILSRIVRRFSEVISGLPPSADQQMTAMTIKRELERELNLIEKETGIGKKDLKVQIANEAGDIYLSFPTSLSSPVHNLAMNNCADICSVK